MKNWKGGLLAVAITAMLLFVYYAHQILAADLITYGAWGDGYKNYYTMVWYLKHDTGARFTGMNYPFGENVLFSDNQPAVSWILKWVMIFVPSIADHMHAFLALSLFVSLLISAVFIYKIFMEFDFDQLNAALFSVLIVMMSPQIQRLVGHFSLSYTCYIPIMLYLLIRFFKTGGKVKYFIPLLLLNSFFIFIHIYYAAMSAMYILLAALAYGVANRKEIKKSFRAVLLLGTIAVTPFVLLKTFLLITDKINDRPKAPWGFIENRSTVFDIVMHPYSFTGEFLGRTFPNLGINYHFEGSGYIGVVTIVTLLAAAIYFIIQRIKGKWAFNSFYPVSLLIVPALGVLLFALAFPFCIHPIQKYYVFLPPAIKQFRAAGRFNWYFYYTATILACLVIYQLFKAILVKNKPLAYSMLLVIYSIWFIEANMISNNMSRDFRQNSLEFAENEYKDELLTKFHNVGKQISDFQAILPLPVFLNGSEKLYIESSISFIAMKQSLVLGLPIAAGQMSRTSLSQTLEMANLLSGPLIKKDVLRFYKNDKPLLVITHGADLSAEERALIGKAKFLFEQRGNRYLELDLSAFQDSIEETKNYVAQNRANFYKHKDYYSTDSTDNVMLKRFEDEPKPYAAFGKGAHYSESNITYFYFDTLPAATDSTNYEISFWVYSDNRRPAYPVLYMTQLDSSGKEVGKAESNAKFSTNSFRDWVHGSINFKLYSKHNKILLMESDVYASFDEIMIRPTSVNVITQFDNDSTFIFNNYPIR